MMKTWLLLFLLGLTYVSIPGQVRFIIKEIQGDKGMMRLRCHCGSVAMHEVTTLQDAIPVFLCVNGHTVHSVVEAPCMAMVAYGPSVPSPEDMLRAVGLWWSD